MTVIGNAVFQVQIDQGLVRNAHHFGLLLEVINGIAVNVNGDLFFQRLGIFLALLKSYSLSITQTSLSIIFRFSFCGLSGRDNTDDSI